MMRPNKKVEENKPDLELNLTLIYNFADFNFDVEYLTEPEDLLFLRIVSCLENIVKSKDIV